MGFEQKVLTDVTNARANAVAAGAQGPAQQAAAENALTGTLRSLFAVVENYPELKANQNVLALQEQLTTTENQIAFSRQHYNATVLDYNTAIADVPERPHRRARSASQARVLRRRARGRDRPERRPQPDADRSRTRAAARPDGRRIDLLPPDRRQPARTRSCSRCSSSACSGLLGFAIGYAVDRRRRPAASRHCVGAVAPRRRSLAVGTLLRRRRARPGRVSRRAGGRPRPRRRSS